MSYCVRRVRVSSRYPRRRKSYAHKLDTGIAGEQEDEAMPDAAHTGRTAGPHGDPVHSRARRCCATSIGALDLRCPRLDASWKRSRCPRRHEAASRMALRSSRTRPGKSTTPPSRSISAASIGPLASTTWKLVRLRTGWQQSHCRSLRGVRTRPAEHTRRALPNGTEDLSQILRAQHASRLKQRHVPRTTCLRRILPTFFPGGTGARALMEGIGLGSASHEFRRQYGVGAPRGMESVWSSREGTSPAETDQPS